MKDIKQVIILRTKYPDGKGGFFKPRTGKLIAQSAHASMKVFFDRISNIEEAFKDTNIYSANVVLTDKMKEWVEGSFKKIVVGIDTEEELIKIYKEAKEKGIPCSMIEDNGLTEFKGVKTKTAVAIGPDLSEKIDLITGDLKLL